MELKEHLSFKDTVIDDIYTQKAQLENQNQELKEEARRKDEIIGATVEEAIHKITQKEAELQKFKADTDVMIRQLQFALGTVMWIAEREISFRKIFVTLFSKSTLPTDIAGFLMKHIFSIASLLKSDEEIWYQEVDTAATSDYFELKAAALSPHYLRLPMTEDIALFASLKDEMMKLPSFIDNKTPPALP